MGVHLLPAIYGKCINYKYLKIQCRQKYFNLRTSTPTCGHLKFQLVENAYRIIEEDFTELNYDFNVCERTVSNMLFPDMRFEVIMVMKIWIMF